MRAGLIPLFMSVVLAAGCAAPMREPAPVSVPAPDESPAPASPAPQDSPVFGSPPVVELARSARQQVREARYDQAVRLLERAIGIEPRNPALWHELARVRYDQGELRRAGQLAARSNALQPAAALKTSNDALIEAAREAGAF